MWDMLVSVKNEAMKASLLKNSKTQKLSSALLLLVEFRLLEHKLHIGRDTHCRDNKDRTGNARLGITQMEVRED